ncbi:SP_1767 family glycosyltransferase [Mesobacillus foraminis]|uniref:Glycosyltransferase family protein n=1 Tax=Mesobacillus foraminis TaxID=279826 RepID=A0A4R2B773_9BACI|nr:SP_1767 family glycosyltransferase [Mesobacillus foraminis]TCN22203.1 glycosyltransferase family protein [Mesobacillus foraminis]
MKKILLTIYYKLLDGYELTRVIKNKIISKLIKAPSVRTTDETLAKIIKESYSISRFGDGEFALMNGKGILFQPYHPELGRRLKEIIKSNQEKHLVCIPNVFFTVEWCTEKAKKYWTKYLNNNRSDIYKKLDMKKEYYDALVTRLYIDHKDKSITEKRFKILKQLWENRHIVIVEGDKSRLGIGNDLFVNALSIERILCPSINAFARYDEILKEIKKHNKNKLILIALGPTATVLSYDLLMMEYQALDIGHIDIEYEWFLKKAMEKVPVKNKYIGEIPNGTNIQGILDQRYKNEIIAKVM